MSKKSKKQKINPNVQRGSNKNFKPQRALPVVEEKKVAPVEVEEEKIESVTADEVIAPVENIVEEKPVEQKVVEKEQKANTKEDKDDKKNKPAKKPKEKGKSKIRETVSELKKVSWPSFKETMKKTGIVIGIVLATAVVLFGIDRLFAFLYDLLTAGI